MGFFILWVLLFTQQFTSTAASNINDIDMQSEGQKNVLVSIDKRETRSEILRQLKEAREKLREDIRACGIQHGFIPMGNCKHCLQTCEVKVTCSRCTSVCNDDKKIFQEKGCTIDRSRINELKRKLGK